MLTLMHHSIYRDGKLRKYKEWKEGSLIRKNLRLVGNITDIDRESVKYLKIKIGATENQTDCRAKR